MTAAEPGTPPIRVLVADDQALIRDSFRLLLDLEPDLELVGEASDGREAVARTRELAPDVVLMDIRMPVLDGLAATEAITRAGLRAHVLILTTYDADEYLYDAMRAGACGFLLKDVRREQLASAIRTVAERCADYDAVVVGPGMQQSRLCSGLAASLLDLDLDRLVLDAAMLYALPPHDDAARAADARTILLPHAREMAALLDCTPEDVQADPLGSGLACAARYDALTLVKGPQSHVVTPGGRAWKYRGGGPGLGVSGSGDTLAGILGGLLARGAGPLTALLWAVWLHGEAGAALGRKVGKVGFLARELAGEIPALLPA